MQSIKITMKIIEAMDRMLVKPVRDLTLPLAVASRRVKWNFLISSQVSPLNLDSELGLETLIFQIVLLITISQDVKITDSGIPRLDICIGDCPY